MVKWESSPSSSREHILASFMESGVREGIFPGGIACIMQGDSENTLACGTLSGEHLSYGIPGEPCRPDTIFDLASLTKVAVTLPCILITAQLDRLHLDDFAADYLPELANGPDALRKQRITVRHLLTHSSGLPAWRPYFIRLRNKEDYLLAIGEEPLERAPGEAVIYSDLGFMLLGWLLERIWEERLDCIAQRLLFEPLGMRKASFRPSSLDPAGVMAFAPTERGNEFERGMALSYMKMFESGLLTEGSFSIHPDHIAMLNWRREPISAEVHDANCYYGLSGISGHAGMFGTLQDLQIYMKLWRDPSIILESWIREATACQVESGKLKRGLGWELFENGVFGHTGFTGTTIYRHDSLDITVIALTNRIHPVVKNGIIEWRTALRKALFSQGN